MMSSASENKIVLVSSEGVQFEVTKAAGEKSRVIREWIDGNTGGSFRLPTSITAGMLEKVIEYCNRHVEAAAGEDLKSFDADFVKGDVKMLYHLFRAAHFLGTEDLIDLIAKTLAKDINKISTKYFRKKFNIKNHLSLNEEDRFLEKYYFAR
ncbi:hypothetical protein OROMI_010168 [Orobanche minor]